MYADQGARKYFYGDDCVLCKAPWTMPQRKEYFAYYMKDPKVVLATIEYNPFVSDGAGSFNRGGGSMVRAARDVREAAFAAQ